MNHRISIGILLLCLVLLFAAGCSKEKESTLKASFDASMEVPEAKIEQETLMAADLAVFDPDEISDEFPEVYAALLADETTGEAILGEHVYDKFYPASITKVMTCLVALENTDLNSTVTFSHDAVFGIPRDSNHVSMNVGDTLTMEQCLQAILIRSANEVSYAVAAHISAASARSAPNSLP